MNIIKKVFNYIIIFIICVAILLGTQVATATIPKDAIKNNMMESAEYYKKVQGIQRIKPKSDYTYIHYYADSVLLNIIYCIDTNNPLESVMWDRMYKILKADVNNDFISVVADNLEPNEQYLRYWHRGNGYTTTIISFI